MLQDGLYALRSETKDAYDEARALEVRWRELEKEQREVYQVYAHLASRSTLMTSCEALHAAVPTHAVKA